MATETKDTWAELRKPFDRKSIGLLPKPTTKDGQKGSCKECGKYHQLPAVHLDYVGHAAVTDRLNNVVGPENWSWEPMATDEHGLPLLDGERNLWIKLTINGVTRPGVGDGSNMKERIGDALRNGAMRFGVALDLWSKEELESTLENPELKNEKPTQTTPTVPASAGTRTAPDADFNTKLNKLRLTLIRKNITGEEATRFITEQIGVPQPTTAEEVDKLLAKLEEPF